MKIAENLVEGNIYYDTIGSLQEALKFVGTKRGILLFEQIEEYTSYTKNADGFIPFNKSAVFFER